MLRRSVLQTLDLREHLARQLVDALGIRAESYGHRVLGVRSIDDGGRNVYPIRSAQIFAQDLAQARLQHLRHRRQRLVFGIDVAVRPITAEYDGGEALGLDTAANRLLDHTPRHANALVRPHFLTASAGQAREVLLHQRAERVQLHVADDHEREVAHVSEAIDIEKVRLLEIHLREQVDRERTPAWVVLAHGALDRFLKRRLGTDVTILETDCHAIADHLEYGLVGARLGDREISQLKHLFEVARRGRADETLLQGTDDRTHRGHLVGEQRGDLSLAESAKAARSDDLHRARGCHPVLVGHQRVAPRASGAQQHLLLAERGRLDHDAGAVREQPLGHTNLIDRSFSDDPAGLRFDRNQRPVDRRVDVGPQPVRVAQVHRG